MIEALIQFFYNKTHKDSERFTATWIENDKYKIPIGNICIHHIFKNIIHDITDDRIIEL